MQSLYVGIMAVRPWFASPSKWELHVVFMCVDKTLEYDKSLSLLLKGATLSISDLLERAFGTRVNWIERHRKN
jgi:hypothetical protein